MSNVNNPNTVNTKNLVDTAAANGSFKTFGKAIERAGMSDILRGVGPFTVFAPTDAAFEADPDELARLRGLGPDELADFLAYYIGEGAFSTDDMPSSVPSIHGDPLEITGTPPDLLVDGVAISQTLRDIRASNGVIQGLDAIFQPPSADEPIAPEPDDEPADEPDSTDPAATDG